MRFIYDRYEQFSEQYAPGDVLAFGGRCFTSRGIELFTTSQVSHVGMVFDNNKGGKALIIESTSLGGGAAGVKIRDLREAVNTYKGRVWYLPIAARYRAVMNVGEFWEFCYQSEGKRYDFLQVAGVALNRIPLLGKLLTKTDDHTSLFCSELVSGAFKVSGLIPDYVDTSHVTPEEVCEFPIFDYAPQLRGPAQPLRCVNVGDTW